MTMGMKRGREDDREVEALAMANCLMLLSQIGKAGPEPEGRIFECKTCNRKFPSFQALGGHRASHKRPKLVAGDLVQHVPPKPKTHECSICGVEFALGQALGGHMRRHRAALENNSVTTMTTTTATTVSDDSLKALPILTRSNSSKRVLCLDLNLSLMPYEPDLKLGLAL